MSSPSSSLRELIYVWEFSRFLMQMSFCGEVVVSHNSNIIKFTRNIRPTSEIVKLIDSCVARIVGNSKLDIKLNIQGNPVYSLNPDRWSEPDVGNPEVFILAHWLTSIYDYMLPTEYVWRKLYPIMFLLSHDYMINCDKVNVDKLLEKYCHGCRNGKRKWIYKQYNCIDLEFTRNTFDKRQRLYEKVEQTLKILKQYNCSIIKYLAEALEYVKNRCHNVNINDNWIRINAYALNELTYTNHVNLANYKDAKINNLLSCNKLRPWLKQQGLYKYVGRKRLWAALKEYILSPIHVKTIAYILGKYQLTNYELYKRLTNICNIINRNCFDLWIQDFVEQLELPGDRWNERIRDAISGYLKYKRKNIAVRDIYNKYMHILKENKLYPIHLDASHYATELLIDLAEKTLSREATALDEFTKTIIENCPRVRGSCRNNNVEFFCPLTIRFLRSEGYGNYILCPFDNVFQCPLFKSSIAELLEKQREHELWHIKCK